MEIPLDFATLKLIWWGLLGVLLIGFALTDGYDLGVATLLPFVARKDEERRLVINSIGPMWEGHQVWFILGGGAIFAAWPIVYAVSFSGFYIAMFLVLSALILRPVGFKYRSKRPEARWRSSWDRALFIGGAVPALIFGVAVGNAILGVPFRLDDTLRMTYEGGLVSGLLALLNPFGLLAGLLSVTMLVTHGAGWLTIKLETGIVRDRAGRIGSVTALVSFALFAAGGVWLYFGIDGYRIAGAIDPGMMPNPLRKSVVTETGAWFSNYQANPWMLIAPALGLAGSVIAFMGLRAKSALSMAGSALAITGIIVSVGVSMFPFILPSSIDPKASLTVWDSSSSHLTLFVMLICTVIFIPLILFYTAWVYKVLWGRVTTAEASGADGQHAY
ncbi:MAG: cytochrome d ubiquinol oxidase subunit II [Hyphomonas sp.]|uniref:cytochrome d ubiquinol oxidase subunit II n=1 Tax=Hyphomonas sp. TaxID=87 RepID=UPI0018010652|nr:cytochrome d ubiquinol oxidase subunit II [Hyphomonas sp.]MBA3067765.1 cytochrome d ubiquinol oxidase subunit II [Hyphomonas sp.]MBU3919489.1 cytochrome d ubiquinol oxidase subunit II [Alphaproteobacteria bacterium]MBU4062147.1 cytochrome d ubiquinol oxidase subunit II [Alphaproteobacteria bacterium]MBU4165582.1 cytochrome d ubiquinol oxidase subunit II [Alphaproteobacteria bacterium]